MTNTHITGSEQRQFAHELMPHAFDSHQALAHLNKASESLGVRFGHEEMHRTDFVDHLNKLTAAGHLQAEAVKKITDKINGISSETHR